VKVPVYNMAGQEVGQTELPENIFNQPFNEGLVHQAVLHFQANQRVGTASTKTRGQVSGGGKKPWRQKGTGRARQGTSRAPHWRGGGVVFGPHPRDYRQLMPQKMRRQALRVALSQRARENAIRIVESLAMAEPQTKQAVALLSALGVQKALLVTPELDRNVYLSARNIPGTETTYAGNLNTFEVVSHPVLIMPVDAIERLQARLGTPAKQENPPETE